MTKVTVRDNNADQAMRHLKRMMEKEGIVKTLRAIDQGYEKPSVRKRMKAKEAQKASHRAVSSY